MLDLQWRSEVTQRDTRLYIFLMGRWCYLAIIILMNCLSSISCFTGPPPKVETRAGVGQIMVPFQRPR